MTVMYRRTQTYAAMIAAVCVLTMGSGCFKTHYVMDGGAGSSQIEDSSHHFVAGLVTPFEPADLNDYTKQCPNGIARVEVKQTFIDGLIGVLTSFVLVEIYRPTTTVVVCK
ncbi:MAG: hypothetical protein AAFX99_04965 [Myxococcota bacterium]